MRKTILASAAASVVCISAAANATPLLFNLNPNSASNGTGTATVADFEAAGLPSSTVGGLSDSQVLFQDTDGTGSAPRSGTPASGITVNGGTNYYGGGGNVANDPTGPAAAVYQTVLFNNPGQTFSASISGLSSVTSGYGLSPLSTYDFYLFPTAIINNDNLNVTMTYGTQQQTITNTPSATPAVFQFTTGAVVSDSLTFSVSDYNYGGSGDRSYPSFASFAIVPVPEPAMVGLAIFGAAGCFLRRRR